MQAVLPQHVQNTSTSADFFSAEALVALAPIFVDHTSFAP